jgi:hypothetical protein
MLSFIEHFMQLLRWCFYLLFLYPFIHMCIHWVISSPFPLPPPSPPPLFVMFSSFINIVANDRMSFFYGWVVFHSVNKPHYPSSTEGHLSWFHIVATVNSASTVSLCYKDFISLWYVPNRIAMSYGSPLFSFLRKFHIVFCNDSTNFHSYQQCIRVLTHVSALLLAYNISYHFDDSHFVWGKMIAHCGLDLPFSGDYWNWAFFMYFYLLFKSVYLVLQPFLNWILLLFIFLSFLYILDVYPLLGVPFANILSCSVGCHFFPLLCRSFLV